MLVDSPKTMLMISPSLYLLQQTQADGKVIAILRAEELTCQTAKVQLDFTGHHHHQGR